MPVSVISPAGRALQASIQNLPPEKAMQKITSSMGTVPLAELLSMKMQLDRLKQAAPEAQYPTTTVAQDMQAELEQGVAALPVPDSMFNENTGNYSRGGVVAFAAGGTANLPVTVPGEGSIDRTPLRRKIPPYKPNWTWGNLPVKAGADTAAAGERMMASGRTVARTGLGALSYPAGVAATGIFDVLDPIPTEDMYAYFGEDPNKPPEGSMARSYRPLTPVEERLQKESAAGYEKWRSENPGLASFMRDFDVRARGEVLRGLSLGMLGPDKGDAERKAKEEAAAPSTLDAPGARLDPLDPVDTSAIVGGSYRGGGPRPSLDDLIRTISDTRSELKDMPTREGEQAAVDKLFADNNIGGAAEARRKTLSDRKTNSDKERKEDRRMALAAAGFKMAEAASRPGATFLGSAAEGGTEAAKGIKEANANYRKAVREVEDAEYQVEQSLEQVRLGKMSMGDARFKEAMENRNRARTTLAQLVGVKAQAETNMYEADQRSTFERFQIDRYKNDPVRIARAMADARWQQYQQKLQEGDPNADMYRQEYEKQLEHASRLATNDSANDKIMASVFKALSEDAVYTSLKNQLAQTQDPDEQMKIRQRIAAYEQNMYDLAQRSMSGASMSGAPSNAGYVDWDKIPKAK